MTYGSEGKDITMVLTGDSLITKRLSVYEEDEDFAQLLDIIRDAPAAFTNFEMLVHDYEGYPAAQSGGTYCIAEPFIADELQWAGFNLFSRANNHSLDYSIGGLLATSRVLDEREMVHAGVGKNLSEARAPGYLDTPQGRVALLSASSTFSPSDRAGAQRGDLKGRPGLNPLRYETVYKIGKDDVSDLKRISQDLGIEEMKRKYRERGWMEPTEEDEYNFLGETFHVTDGETRISTEVNEKDERENLKWVEDAKRQSDWVVFSLHVHRGRLDREKSPCFVHEFARNCIDKGADVFVAHGPHVLRGIEIYEGKPIFYGLGNFIFQNETVRRLPADIYERYDLDDAATPADVYDKRTDNDSKGFPAEEIYWESVMPQLEFENRQLKRISLYPVTLGHDRPRPQRGRPVMAKGELGKKILEKMSQLCEEYGTEVRIENGSSAKLILD